MHAVAADQAGNDGLEGGVRGKLLGFRRDLRFFRSLFAFQRSTQDEGRSTLDLVPRTIYFQNWDSRSTLPPEQVDTGSIPRTICLQNGTAGRCKMRAGRHWTSFPEQPVFSVSTPPPG
ncbi:hypothetical protein Taro_038693 [Colocasia esculenta]|uniref:Uncharacterized protein n=1 Tax=Colocasia esculenta TaxID=4460 RepID=A0A843WDJ7_COLES|nr:hypothetical protein [Colocasia esculenta]